MINYNYETDFILENESLFSNWLSSVIISEKAVEGEINYIFCSDEALFKINVQYLNHDTFTDIISFDYSVGKELHGDIYISVDRVRENSKIYSDSFLQELKRVMVHGLLHYCGYKDKTEEDAAVMRRKEDYYISSFSEV